MKNYFPWWLTPFLLLAGAVALKVVQPPFMADLQLKVFDTYQMLSPRPYEDVAVRIVDIDDASLEKIGQWPWPRTVMARLVDRLRETGAAAIALDIVFAEEDRTSPRHILPLWQMEDTMQAELAALPDHDALFAEALARAPVVTGAVLTHGGGRAAAVKAGFSFVGGDPLPYLPAFTGAVPSLAPIEQAASGNGMLNSDPDRDGILRRIPLVLSAGGKLYPSLAAETLRVAQGVSSYVIKTVGASDEVAGSGSRRGVTAVKIGAVQVPTDASGQLWIYFTEHVPERYIPAWKVLDTPGSDLALEGHIVLVGTTAAGLKDLRATPLNPAAGGIEVHAQALEQMLLGTTLSRPDWIEGAEIVLMVLTGMLMIAFTSRLHALWAAGFMVCALAGAVALSWYGFRAGRVLVEPVTPGLVIVLLYFSETLRRFFRTEQERSRIRSAFKLYMAPSLVDELAAHPERLRLGGESREVTVMFCDIREFSAISERMSPVELTAFINRFLTPMTEVVMRHGGTIDKYIGDCIMALWNAPLDHPRHAESAARAALQMRAELFRFNALIREEEGLQGRIPLPIRIGIGVNTGECCVGNMGSALRFEYSALGNAVDLASRLESLCKLYGVETLLGPNTHEGAAALAALEMDLIRVKGKTEPIRIHALMGDEAMRANPLFEQLERENVAMLSAYRTQQWEAAQRHLTASRDLAFCLPEPRLSVFYRLYEERIAHFRRNPLPPGWDGVFEATFK